MSGTPVCYLRENSWRGERACGGEVCWQFLFSLGEGRSETEDCRWYLRYSCGEHAGWLVFDVHALGGRLLSQRKITSA